MPGQVEGVDEFASWFLDLDGDKTGNNRWYDENIPVADDRYDDFINDLEKEGLR